MHLRGSIVLVLLLGGAALGSAAYAVTSPRRTLAPAPIHASRAPARFDLDLDVRIFHKGNLHTHSLESDGDSVPEDVYRWYRTHGYQFVALTDHNRRIEPAVYRHLERPDFKILAGEEITMAGAGRQVHVNALCTHTKIGGGGFATKAEALRFAIDAVDAQGGVSLINHPNFDRSLGPDDLWEGRGATLLEIYSGHPYVYSDGVDERPSHEALWAELATRGAGFHGTAVDDTHHLKPGTSPEKTARPGKAWVATFAESAEVEETATCEALRAGRFYASNGATLMRLHVSDRTLRVWPLDPRATVVFLGPGDEVLATERAEVGEGAGYTLRGDERWVRARIEEPGGAKAWTQPLRTR